MLLLQLQMREFLRLRRLICRSSCRRFGIFLPTAYFLCKRRFSTLASAASGGFVDL